MTPVVYDIDEAAEARSSLTPIVRLANLLIRECLKAEVMACRLRPRDHQAGTASLSKDGTWQEVMRFPLAAHMALVKHLGLMGEAEVKEGEAREGTITVRWQGDTHEIGVRLGRAADDVSEALLTF